MPGAPDLLLPAPRALSAFPFLRGARCSVRKAPPLFCVSARLDPLPALNMPPTGPPPAAAAYRPQTGSPDGSCTFASTSPPGHRFPIPPTPPRPQAWGFHPARDDTCPHHTAPIGNMTMSPPRRRDEDLCKRPAARTRFVSGGPGVTCRGSVNIRRRRIRRDDRVPAWIGWGRGTQLRGNIPKRRASPRDFGLAQRAYRRHRLGAATGSSGAAGKVGGGV